MLQTSQAFREAIVGSPRQIELFAVVDISDPDKVFESATTSMAQAPWSRPEQLHDYDLSLQGRYATGERGRWLLDGTFDIFPDGWQAPNETGFAGEGLSGPDGSFQDAPWIQLNFSGVRILQAFSLYFSTDPADGVPYDFTVEVFSGSQRYYVQDVEGSTRTEVQFRNFTVYDPTAVRLTVRRWSLPGRRVRAVEFVIGFFERWDGDALSSFSASLQGQFDCLSMPYGSVRLGIDNSSRMFEPRRKDSIFQSIEERQGVDLFIGCQTAAGMERVKIGVFYQAGDGWKTSENAPVIDWYMVDIIGLVRDRTFLAPDPLPDTLGGWLKAIVSQLGAAFENRWHVDPGYANKAVTAGSRADVEGKKCGDILRWACQASGTWPRAGQKTGALTAEPLWNQGNKLTLDNMEKYPGMKANKSLAALIFWLTGEEAPVVIPGNSTTSEDTITIRNPFLHTADQARAAARLILAQYGGNLLEITGRGDPSSEIGDVDTVWLDKSNAATARRMSQSFQFQGGVMRGCRTSLLQADGSYLYTEFVILDQDEGDWTAPEGVTDYRLILSDGGQGGGYGKPGYVGGGWSGAGPSGTAAGYGEPGQDGQGGKVWYGTINLNSGQIVHYKRGKGGAAATQEGGVGAMGQPSVFGAYSSENGTYYPNGYTDIANGKSFCRTGVEKPLPGSGDGGKGGEGGEPGSGYWEQLFWPDGRPRGWHFEVTSPPGPGKPGVDGASGFIMVTWEKPETAL